ncbi:MAG: PEP-CTERM/exosortase system-associated acyltransferase [Nitrosomonas sp.]|nr:PEP-CTERM/exosortase system-associated acyltransferase [Nitrosomonas sp.]
MNEIKAAFDEYFEIVNADTPELLEEVFALRYRILCVHNTFPDFSGSRFPDGLEHDEYDSRAVHVLLRHRSSGIFVGTVRLILPDQRHPENKFPTELHTRFFPGVTLDTTLRQQIGEVSRFAILSEFFRRKKDHVSDASNGQNGQASVAKHDRRRFPHPMLALVVGVIRLCARHKVYHLLSSMDPALNKLLGFYSLQLDPIGPTSDYHGVRCPYHVYVPDMLDRVRGNNRDTWELVTDHGEFWSADLSSLRNGHRRLMDTATRNEYARLPG